MFRFVRHASIELGRSHQQPAIPIATLGGLASAPFCPRAVLVVPYLTAAPRCRGPATGCSRWAPPGTTTRGSGAAARAAWRRRAELRGEEGGTEGGRAREGPRVVRLELSRFRKNEAGRLLLYVSPRNGCTFSSALQEAIM